MTQRSDIATIKSKLSLVDIAKRFMELKRAGGRWVAPCPFHQETKPSFSINEEEGVFYCFGCQASGDLIDFYCRINGLEFREGLVQLAEEAGVELTKGGKASPQAAAETDFKKNALKLHDLALRHFVSNLRAKKGELARKYIENRKISPEMTQAFELGYSLDEWQGLADYLQASSGLKPEFAVKAGLLSTSEKGGRVYDRFRARLMFPIKNLSGRVIAFGGRIIENASADTQEQAKYINSSDSPIYKKGEHLYGLYQARKAITQLKSAVLTEGYLDVISLHQYGFTNACGVLGTALTKEQVKRLAGFCSNIELIFDGDNPGRKAALRSSEMILGAGLDCTVVILPDGEDIDSLLQNKGPEAFEALRKTSLPGLKYCADYVKGSMAPKERVEWLKSFLTQVETKEYLPTYISELSLGLGLDEQQIRTQFGSGLIKKSTSQEKGPQYSQPGWSNKSYPREVLHHVACFPEIVDQLNALAMEKIMVDPIHKGIWAKLLEFGQNDVFDQFTPEEKSFWLFCREKEPLPRDNLDEVLIDLKQRLEEILDKETRTTYKGVLRQLKTGPDSGLEFLRVLTERQRNSDG